MINVIHIFGASGSGTTTLGEAIDKILGYKHLDVDDYFWIPSDPPYATKRELESLTSILLFLWIH